MGSPVSEPLWGTHDQSEQDMSTIPTTVMLALRTVDSCIQDLMGELSKAAVEPENRDDMIKAVTELAEAMSLAIFAERMRYEQEKR